MANIDDSTKPKILIDPTSQVTSPGSYDLFTMRKSAEVGELAKALSQAQHEMKPAVKNRENPFFKSTYADLESVIGASRDILSKHGLSVTQFPTTLRDETGKPILGLYTMLLHSSGQWIGASCPVIYAKHTAQDAGAGISYFRRFAYSGVAGVVTEDDDGNQAADREVLDHQHTPAEVQQVRHATQAAPASHPQPAPRPAPHGAVRRVSEKQSKFLFAMAMKFGWKPTELEQLLVSKFGSPKTDEVPADQVDNLLKLLNQGPPSKHVEQAPPIGDAFEPADEIPF